jgi:stringent starvation protein B
MGEISTKPYLIRAIHEWCTDCGYRPYIAVSVDEGTIVPREFVRGGEIVLNVSVAATNRLVIGNDTIEFEARFGGIARSVSIPVANVSAIYAQETGHGMAFDVPRALAQPAAASDTSSPDSATQSEPPAGQATDEPAADGGRKRSRPTLVPVSSSGAGKPAADLPEERPAGATGKPARKPRAASTRSRKSSSSPELVATRSPGADAAKDSPPDDPGPRPPAGKPSLTRVK